MQYIYLYCIYMHNIMHMGHITLVVGITHCIIYRIQTYAFSYYYITKLYNCQNAYSQIYICINNLENLRGLRFSFKYV